MQLSNLESGLLPDCFGDSNRQYQVCSSSASRPAFLVSAHASRRLGPDLFVWLSCVQRARSALTEECVEPGDATSDAQSAAGSDHYLSTYLPALCAVS